MIASTSTLCKRGKPVFCVFRTKFEETLAKIKSSSATPVRPDSVSYSQLISFDEKTLLSIFLMHKQTTELNQEKEYFDLEGLQRHLLESILSTPITLIGRVKGIIVLIQLL